MDPLSAAAGLAKTAGVAAGAANSASKNSIVHALYLPAAKAWGEYNEEKAREKIAAAKVKKRQKNLQSHLEAVQSTVKDEFAPDPGLAEEWIAGAERVDPIDEELSAAWRAVLLAIGSGEPYRQRLLDAVKTMTPDEASVFMWVAERHRWPRGETTTDYRCRFEALKLMVRPLDLALNSSTYSVAVMLFVVLGFSIGGAILAPSLVSSSDSYGAEHVARTVFLLQASSWLLVLSLVGLAMMQVQKILFRPVLTDLGRALSRLSQRALVAEAAREEPDPPRSRKARATREGKHTA